MNLAICLAPAIIPALIIVIHFYRKDGAKPEPEMIIIRIFAALAEDASAGKDSHGYLVFSGFRSFYPVYS